MTSNIVCYVPKNRYGKYDVLIRVHVENGRYTATFEGDTEDLQLLFRYLETRMVPQETGRVIASLGPLDVKWAEEKGVIYFTWNKKGMRPQEVLQALDDVLSLKRQG